MTSIDEIGQVIKYASQLEKLLDSKFSSELESKRAAGISLKGLGDKVKALESYLPDSARKDLWVIVKIRNNVAHEGSLGNDNLSNYVGRYEKVIIALQSIEQSTANLSTTPQQLDHAATNPTIKNSFLVRITGLIAAVVAVIVFFILSIPASSMFLNLADFFDKTRKPLGTFIWILLHTFGWVGIYYLIRYAAIKPVSGLIRKIGGDNGVVISVEMLCVFILFLSAAFAFFSNDRIFLGLWMVALMLVAPLESYFEKFGNTRIGNVSKQNGSNELALYAPRKPAHTFNEVQGMTALKAELLAAVEKHKTAKKNGILLSGDPGNGKTFIAEALAGELRWGFMPITIADIQSRWIGQSTEQLKAVFDAAARSAPLVLFFDECDSMLRDRASMMGGTDQEPLKMVNTFLTGIVDIRSNPNIIVIAASNYKDQLDAAATRDGRFDFKIEIPNPDKEARLGLLTKFSKGVVFEDGVLDRLVKRWEGFSVVRISSIAEKILDNAKAQGRESVGVKEVMTALRTIQGSSGAILPEGTPKLENLRFDQEQRVKLMSLAKRMENIEEVERMGGQVPKGVLFFGPPGTGKTAVAKALAMTSGWAFLPTSGNDLLAGDGNAIDKLIAKARDLRPCIIFIDEAENALGDRTTNRYGSAVTNKILSVTDGVNALQDVMFVAATNHPSQLDAAIVRGGRFSEHYEFKKPEEDTVLAMVREWLAERTGSTPFHDEFTPDAAAQFLHGHSPADIKDLLQQAVNTGVGRILSGDSAEKKITIADLQAVMKA